ncbi:hypothetical protein D3C81_2249970 [compost metagenome]
MAAEELLAIRVYSALSQEQDGDYGHPLRALAFPLCGTAAQRHYAAKKSGAGGISGRAEGKTVYDRKGRQG